MVLAVAIAGKMGSGKTTTAEALAEKFSWPRASFGDYVRTVVDQQGLPQTRENLQRIGTELLRNDPHAFCRSVLKNCGWRVGENLVIDGLRHEETIDIIRDLIYPATLKIVFVSVPEQTRLRRLRERGEGDIETILNFEAHSSEQQVPSVIRDRADLLLQTDKGSDVTIAELTEWIENQQ